MITVIKQGNVYNRRVISLEGLSTDIKPIEYFVETDSDGVEVAKVHIENGSIFTEIDTGDTYMYDIDNAIWHKVSLNGGNVDGHFVAGANINITLNADGTETISASGEISSEDGVARQNIANHIADESNPHKVTKAQIGLGNVDNTADIAKPVSTATQTALNAKANSSDVYTKVETDSLIGNKQDTIADLSDIRSGAALGATAIQPISGKGLSSNDYTNADKTKLTNLVNIKSIGTGLSINENTGELIATGGESDTTDYSDITNKPQINGVTLTGNKTGTQLGLANTSDIPTTLAELTADTSHRTVTDTEKATWDAKQNALIATQLDAVNSGITSTGVSQIATNTNNIASINQTIGDINSVLEEVL